MSEADAAVAIVHARGPEESILLMRRSERADDPWSGHWAFPGGRRDPADPDLLHTALRELHEECGIRLRRQDLEEELPARPARRRAGAYVPVTPFLFRVKRELPAAPDEREAVEALWAPLRVLRDPGRHRLLPVPGHPEGLRYPAVALNHVPLWGFTYRLICDWLGLSPNGQAAHRAGPGAAGMALEFLLSQGLTLLHGWDERESAPCASRRVAEVRGVVPVAPLLDLFSPPRFSAPDVNCLEVRPDRVRVLGLEFEEYLILATG